MESMNAEDAAKFLFMHPDTLRAKACAGIIPATKTGKRWVFIKEHLADWVSGRYTATAEKPPLRLIVNNHVEAKKCPLKKEAITGGFGSPNQTASEYKSLLKLR